MDWEIRHILFFSFGIWDFVAIFATNKIKKMAEKNSLTMKSQNRIASIDVMRALTMLLMLFVNDIPGLDGVPHWMFHAAYDEDMLGFSDVIFPAFLFCVGMSIPLAVNHRLQRGDSWACSH